jgi:predicted nucleic acid-binding protein
LHERRSVIYVARQLGHDARLTLTRYGHMIHELDDTPLIEAVGHALGQREHTADRWIAATAIRLGIPLVSNDRIFHGAPGVNLESLAPD